VIGALDLYLMYRLTSQYRHFFNETATHLLVAPTPLSNNPWLQYLSHLALGKPAGSDLTHDAFRLGLLSLATFDMGHKMHNGLRNPVDNAMYATSAGQRDEAIKGLKVGIAMGTYKVDLEAADLALGTLIALAIRDVGVPVVRGLNE
jgi:hypothetical protein